MNNLEYRLRLQDLDNRLSDLSHRIQRDRARWEAEDAEAERLARLLDDDAEEPTPEQAIAEVEAVLADIQADRRRRKEDN